MQFVYKFSMIFLEIKIMNRNQRKIMEIIFFLICKHFFAKKFNPIKSMKWIVNNNNYN